jgi:hypothetical protein
MANNIIDNAGRDKLDFRLNCFGGYDGQDPICRVGCALALNCAMTKASYFRMQVADDRSAPPPFCRPRRERE